MRPLLVLFALFIALTPTTSWAQDDAEAVKLFQEGRAAIQRKDYNVACAKFEQSNAIDPRVGTLLNLALCEEQRGRLVRALEVWRSASELSQRLSDPREKEANERASKLVPRIPKLTLTLPADAPKDVSVRVEIGTLAPKILSATEIAAPIAVDPGKVAIFVLANGGETQKEIEVAEGATETVVLEVPVAGSGARPGADEGGSGVDGLMVAGFVVGGVGLLGLGVGAAFGAIAKSKNDESMTGDQPCDANYQNCGPEALAANDEARFAATGSTVAFIAGGVLAAAGITLIVVSLTSSDEPAAAARLHLGVTPTGVNAQLTW